MKRAIFICGGGGKDGFGYRVTKDTRKCKLCTDVGTPGGYTQHEEWHYAMLKKGRENIQCPLCLRYCFRGMFKKPHARCHPDINAMRKVLRSGNCDL